MNTILGLIIVLIPTIPIWYVWFIVTKDFIRKKVFICSAATITFIFFMVNLNHNINLTDKLDEIEQRDLLYVECIDFSTKDTMADCVIDNILDLKIQYNF